MSIDTNDSWGPPDPGWFEKDELMGGGFRSGDEDTNYGGSDTLRHGEKIRDTRNTRDIALEAKEATKKIKDDLAFIKERLHELVNETSTHEEERASLEKKLADLDANLIDGPYKPTIPNQDLFAIDVDKLIKDLGEVFRIEKEMIATPPMSDRDHINIVAAHVGNVLWKHLRLPTELYDAWIEAADCGLGKK